LFKDNILKTLSQNQNVLPTLNFLSHWNYCKIKPIFKFCGIRKENILGRRIKNAPSNVCLIRNFIGERFGSWGKGCIFVVSKKENALAVAL
jgi:hypothetical protein